MLEVGAVEKSQELAEEKVVTRVIAKEEVQIVSIWALEHIIMTYWKLNRFNAHMGAVNDKVYQFKIEKKAFSEQGQEKLALMRNNGFCTIHELGLLLNALAQEKILKPGKLLVQFYL